MSIDPDLLIQAGTAVMGGLTGLAGAVAGNRFLRAKIQWLKERIEDQASRHEDEKEIARAEADRQIKALEERHVADVLNLRREYGDVTTARAIETEILRDDLTALAFHAAEKDLKLAEAEANIDHFARQIERITGIPAEPPPGISRLQAEKILSESGIFRTTPDPDQLTGGNIFVVEDHPDLRRQVSSSLRRAGYEVFTAATVAEARRVIDEFGPLFNLALLDLMLMDAGNGHVGGDAVAEYLREVKNRVPIVITTAMDHHEARRYVKDLGAVGCIRKPYLMPQLIATVAEHVRT